MKIKSAHKTNPLGGYDSLVNGIARVFEEARRSSARVINSLMTAAYWEIGRRIVEYEQKGNTRAKYGEELLERISSDLTSQFRRGFSRQNLQNMRQFYLAFRTGPIRQTVSGKSLSFPLSWSHYVLLVNRSRSSEALTFYHAESLRGGWSVRQLERQIDSQFYERTALSRKKNKMLTPRSDNSQNELVAADQELKDPLVLEFLNLKDEYSESDLEDALIHHLEHFLLELGNDFAFIARQRRLRIDNHWYRVDLLLFHRSLRCLVIIDLKLGHFTHADAGQMHLYLNYAREHWMTPNENQPVGLILCAGKGESLVRYATENLPNKVIVRKYLTTLPDERRLAEEISQARHRIENRMTRPGERSNKE